MPTAKILIGVRADLPALGLLAPPSLVSPTVTDGTGKGLKRVAVYMGQELSLFCHFSRP